MSYHDVWLMTLDTALSGRLAAAASVEGAEGDPEVWRFEHRYDLCSAPGWGDAWASALASGNPSPGDDPGVITDPMILSQTQAVLGA